MAKSDTYLSHCMRVASKSDMKFKLGAVVVKGGKVLAQGYNHHRYVARTNKPLSLLNVTQNRLRRPSLGKLQPYAQLTRRDACDTPGRRHAAAPDVAQRDGNMLHAGDDPGVLPFIQRRRRLSRFMRRPLAILCEHWRIRAAPGMRAHRGIGVRECKNAVSAASYALPVQYKEPTPSTRRLKVNLPVFPSSEQLYLICPSKIVHGRTNGADIYVVRTNAAGPADAAPCARCLAWCTWSGVRRVFFWSAARGSFACARVAQPGESVYATRSDRTRGVGQESFER
jgi:hypothetical protein